MTSPTPPPAAPGAMQAHSPLPWSVMGHNDRPPMIMSGESGGCVAKTFEFVDRKERGEALANAAFIVTACNGFDSLITLAKNCRNELPESSPLRQQAMEILSRIQNQGMH